MDVSRVALIRRWSMDGARGDLDRRFVSPVDIHAAVAQLDVDAQIAAAPAFAPPPVLLKPAGDGDWRPLLADTA